METCPSCHSPVNSTSRYCNVCGYNLTHEQYVAEESLNSGRSYRLRSPILESSVLYDDKADKKHGMLLVLSYALWLFALIFVILGVLTIYKNYTIDLFLAAKEGASLFTVAFFCFIFPAILSIFIDIEESISVIARETRKDRMD